MKSNAEIVNRMENLLDAVVTNNLAQRETAHQEALQLSQELLSRATNNCSGQYCLEYDEHINRLLSPDSDVNRNRTELLGALRAIDNLRSSHGFGLE